MKQIFFVLISLILAAYGHSQEKIAVLNLKGININNDIVESVTETLMTSIAEYKKYKVIERAQLDKIFEELKLTNTDDFEEDTIIDIGKLAKAKKILVGSVSKVGNKYIMNVRVIEVETGNVDYATNIACENRNDIFKTTIKIAKAISGLEEINEKVIEAKNTDEDDYNDEINQDAIESPKYIFNDEFNEFNKSVWKIESKTDMDVTVNIKNGKLYIYAPKDRGVNRVISIISKEFNLKESFSLEIKFKDLNLSSNNIQFIIGTKFWNINKGLRVSANIDEANYGFYWYSDEYWIYNEKKILDGLFNDENIEFHTFKIIYDYENKTGYGFIDDRLIDYIKNYEFKKGDKFFIQLFIYQYGKDELIVEFDDFKSSIPLETSGK